MYIDSGGIECLLGNVTTSAARFVLCCSWRAANLHHPQGPGADINVDRNGLVQGQARVFDSNLLAAALNFGEIAA